MLLGALLSLSFPCISSAQVTKAKNQTQPFKTTRKVMKPLKECVRFRTNYGGLTPDNDAFPIRHDFKWYRSTVDCSTILKWRKNLTSFGDQTCIYPCALPTESNSHKWQNFTVGPPLGAVSAMHLFLWAAESNSSVKNIGLHGYIKNKSWYTCNNLRVIFVKLEII